MIRLWFLDGNYMDILVVQFQYYSMDPNLKCWEYMDEEEEDLVEENGHMVRRRSQ